MMLDYMTYLEHMSLSSVALYAALAGPAYLLLYSLFSRHSLRHIPTLAGPTLPVLSYLGAVRFFKHTKEVLQEGYAKYYEGTYKVAMYDQWLVIVNGTKLVDEIQKMPDEKTSLVGGLGELLATNYILGSEFHGDPYHVALIRSQLTRNIGNLFGKVHDEIERCFADMVPAADKEWVPITTISTFLNMVARVSSRVFVGDPLCHDPRYLALSTGFTIDYMKARDIINRCPVFMKPWAARYFANIDDSTNKAMDIVGPIVEERMRLAAELGDSWDKPKDMLQWMIDEVGPRGYGSRSIVRRLLGLNFVAISTTSNSLCHAVHHLAASPEVQTILREEVEQAVAEHGWNKTAVGKMYKLDSFLRENQRYNGNNLATMFRKTVSDVTLSDGTFLPKGTLLVAPTAVHQDDANYENPEVFNPWRFADMRGGNEGKMPYQYVDTSAEYIPFGHGKHACPGRFFAANELKTIMAHIVANYDVKLPQDGQLPKVRYVFLTVMPDPSTRVLFRKRT